MENLRTTCCLCTLCVTRANILCKYIYKSLFSLFYGTLDYCGFILFRAAEYMGEIVKVCANLGSPCQPSHKIVQHKRGELCVDAPCFRVFFLLRRSARPPPFPAPPPKKILLFHSSASTAPIEIRNRCNERSDNGAAQQSSPAKLDTPCLSACAVPSLSRHGLVLTIVLECRS